MQQFILQFLLNKVREWYFILKFAFIKKKYTGEESSC
jgi:hypothetical protein